MEWTYAEADVSEGFTSEILDIYGYFLFAAPFMTMIPGFINKIVESWTGSRKSSELILLKATKLTSGSYPKILPLIAIFETLTKTERGVCGTCYHVYGLCFGLYSGR